MNIISTTNPIRVAKANIATSTRVVSLNILRVIQSAQEQITSLSRKTEKKFMKAVKENNVHYVEQKLMKHPKFVEKLLKEKSYKGKFTALGLACYCANQDMMTQLLQAGADINQVDKDGSSPLMFAVESGSLDAVELLLKYKPNVNQQNNIGNNCSAIAAADNELEILKALIEHGVNIHNRTTKNQTNILMVACVYGNFDIVRFLHAKGIDVNQQTAETKTTALHLAAKYDHAEIVNFLLEEGANPKLTDIDGHIPLCYARQNENDQIIEILTKPQQETK